MGCAVLCEPDLGQLSRLQHSIFPCPSCVIMALLYLLVLTSSFGYLCHHYLSLSDPYLPHNELFTLPLLLKVGLSGVPWSLRPVFDQLMLQVSQSLHQLCLFKSSTLARFHLRAPGHPPWRASGQQG